MEIERFSTNDVTQSESFDYWRDAVCDAYVRLGCESENRSNFCGDIQLQRLSRLSLSYVTGRAHEVKRRRRDIARSEDAYFLVSVQLKARSTVEQHDRVAGLKPGDFTLYSSTEPYNLKLGDYSEQLVVQIPRSELLLRLPNADLLTGRRVCGSTGLGKLVSNNIIHFAAQMDNVDELVQQHMQETMVNLVSTGMCSVTNNSNPTASVAKQQLLLRAKHTILTQLSDPELNRSAVSSEMKVSVRRLNEVFSTEGTSISSFIRDRRLERIAEELSDIRFTSMSISEIAMRWGINNFQHFSRLFRKQFGVSPREYRNGVRLPLQN